jgi:hypothetical protein
MAMSRIVKEPTKSSLELDCINARHTYCYTENRPSIVAWVKRQIHKRDRRRALDSLAREAQELGFY